MIIKKLYIRELPQQQYHYVAYQPILVPSKCLIDIGDKYVDTHVTYTIDKILMAKAGRNWMEECNLLCTVTKNDTICKNPHYIKRRR